MCVSIGAAGARRAVFGRPKSQVAQGVRERVESQSSSNVLNVSSEQTFGAALQEKRLSALQLKEKKKKGGL